MHSKRPKSVLLDTGEEPYRAVGVDVNEAEILNVAARAQVSKAQDQYSKMYREVHSIPHHIFLCISKKSISVNSLHRQLVFQCHCTSWLIQYLTQGAP